MMRAFALMIVLALLALAQKPEIKQVAPKPTNPAAGAEMFREYCAACHGVDGKGGGPAAPAMKKPVPDLTLLSKNNGGKFPETRVYNSIQGDMVASHGSKDMPIWGNVLRGVSRDEATVKMRLTNLTNYIKSIQR
ncbi:MAG: cytochrome c [Bryobacteraceae bacterium]|nr:cytochrome c [Bryobacteraceae bacterium]MDW8380410.1 cytochrome c [Bryobacterales bacterium]